MDLGRVCASIFQMVIIFLSSEVTGNEDQQTRPQGAAFVGWME
jgi:hypothetical protein